MVLEWFNIFKFYFFSMKETCTFCDEEACVFSPPWPVEYLLHCTLPVQKGGMRIVVIGSVSNSSSNQ